MKKIILAIIAVVINITIYANDDLKMHFCDGNSKTISEKELLECDKVTLNSDVWKIKSFYIGYTVGGDFKSVKVAGDKFPESISHSIKAHSPDKIFFEKILLINGNGEEKEMPTQVIIITK